MELKDHRIFFSKLILVSLTNEMHKKIESQIDDIFNGPRSNGRSRELISEHTIGGSIIEVATVNALNIFFGDKGSAELNPEKFDYRNENTYNKDVIFTYHLDNKKINYEVKSVTPYHEFWFNNGKDHGKSGLDLTNFITAVKKSKLDFLILGSIDENISIKQSEFNVNLWACIKADDYESFRNNTMVPESDVATHVFSLHPAVMNNCAIVNTNLVKL